MTSWSKTSYFSANMLW